MELTRQFSQLNKNDANLAGGKGASLGEMTQAGIPVPNGFVVLSDSFEQFIKETDLIQEIDSILHNVNHKEIHTVENASEQIKALILAAEMPKDIADDINEQFKKLGAEYVAVRSSATAEDGAEHAWAGQLESYLNITEKDVLSKVQHCWASLFTPRAIFYRFEKGLHSTKISVAVVVQKMVNSELSGIAFSVHPITEDYNQLIIEAGFGLGEAIVSGQITPDSYVVEKEPRRILDINVNKQKKGLYRKQNGGNEWKDIPESQGGSQVLNEQQILELSQIVLTVENHYGFPCDIEWAYESGKFYIVQSRPITTLSGNKQEKKIILSKVFSREKTLFYFSMWNDSDRMGWKNFLNYTVKNNLFLVPPPGQKGSVWYSQKELGEIDNLLKKELENNKKLITSFKDTLDSNWSIIFPYLSDKKKLASIEEFENYYQHLVEWWSAMNTAFGIPDMENLPEETRNIFLSYRAESEKFTEKMNKVLVAFWNDNFPELINLTFCVSPNEIRQIAAGSKEIIEAIRERKEGCFMLNEQIYPIKELENKLQDFNLSLEQIAVEDEKQIKGNPAYRGKVQGKIRKILSFKDMKNFKAGEVLVTEMTNPDYLPIMKIASAVITDEGGATCHAAIACRELKIPCIVGTKVATQVLLDGVEVDVDADNGLIKILSQKEGYNPSDYIRMFAGKSFPYLFSNVFLGYYNSLDVVSVQGDGSWICFFPKALVGQTNKEGKELYGSKTIYKKYKQEFDDHIDTSRKYFESAIKKNEINKDDVNQFFKHVSNLFVYYSKTEFFYTDGVDQTKMAITVKEFDDLKLGGRAYLNSLFFEGNGYIKSFVRRIAKQTGAQEIDLLNYNVEELAALIETGTKLSQEEVERRHTFFESKDLIQFGPEAKPLIDDFFSNYLQISDVIKGTIANKGKVRGKARVLVPDAKDFDKIAHAVKEMKEGEILVAETTSPDIIAACKKAAAIITNQGGQLSHAAIVSRELGIPCVIGTDKDVILNIKTGDEIEVDANQGIIRILK